VVVETPLLESPLLNAAVGGRVIVKPECLQRTGSFKYRGASNRIRRLDKAGLAAGVVAYSSGNHAQGVALAARDAGTKAIIVMPQDTPAIKIANTKAYGAEVRLYDRFGAQDRADIALEIAKARGAVLIPPFDDPHIIAGQGTVGLEIDRQLSAIGVTPDQLLCCCGGGGLIAGTSLSLKARRPDLPIYACEPADFDDTRRSLISDRREVVDPDARSICDALLSKQPGEMTFAINRHTLSGALVASDAEVRHAMRIAFTTLKLVVEPGGAIALAALLAGRIEAKDRTSVVILSGGNTDPAFFAEVLCEE